MLVQQCDRPERAWFNEGDLEAMVDYIVVKAMQMHGAGVISIVTQGMVGEFLSQQVSADEPLYRVRAKRPHREYRVRRTFFRDLRDEILFPDPNSFYAVLCHNLLLRDECTGYPVLPCRTSEQRTPSSTPLYQLG